MSYCQLSDLKREDLLQYEQIIKDNLARFFSFNTSSLYFPQQLPQQMLSDEDSGSFIPWFSTDEKRLLLPLVWQKKFLAVFMADGVIIPDSLGSLDLLVPIAELCLHNLCLYKNNIRDQLTGLVNPERLHSVVEHQIESILHWVTPGKETPLDLHYSGYSACFSILLLDVDSMRQINLNYGYEFGDWILQQLSRLISDFCPEQACLSRYQGDRFALLLPQTGPENCKKLCQKISEHICQMPLKHWVTEEEIKVQISIGHASYPQDMPGRQLKGSSVEQGRIIIDKAQQALLLAQQDRSSACCAFQDILSSSGQILKIFSPDRFLVNIGSNADASEGMHFLVCPNKEGKKDIQTGEQQTENPGCKGEIMLVEVDQETALAELLHLNDPGYSLQPGDKLSLVLPEKSLFSSETEPLDGSVKGQTPSKDLLSLREFISYWNHSKSKYSTFSLILMRFDNHHFPGQTDKKGLLDQENHILQDLIVPLLPEQTITGLYSTSACIYYLPGISSDEAFQIFKQVAEQVAETKHLHFCIGIASYPYLHFSKAEVLHNCRKALEHALMLGSQQVAVFDSVSLNISADRYFAHGDLLTALEEYQNALLADEKNIIARNSLGICYARMGDLIQAKNQFKKIIDMNPKEIMALYNYGYACLKLEDYLEAKETFETCLKLQPEHIFSLLRLGLLAEKEGNYERAREYYLQAKNVPDGEKSCYRYLANLALKEENEEEARHYLHQALLANPNDASAMHLLAKLYLTQDEDPEIAETLARKSANICPQLTEYWELLQKALQIQGKDSQALSVYARANGSKTSADYNRT
jgi:diguanylate cyclase (GGDEF)-like protein